MGGAAKTIGRVGSGVFTLGGSEIARNNLGPNNILSRGLQAPGAILTGGQSGFGGSVPGGGSGAGDFNMDPNMSANDQAAINALGKSSQTAMEGLGQKQYGDTLTGIQTTGDAETQRAKDLFGQMLPGIAENSQAAHLYDSTGYGQEVGRQQANIASQVAEQEAQQKLSALGALGGTQTGALNTGLGFQNAALQRGTSLEDFQNQAHVAQALGAQMAPKPASGKADFGAAAQGVGALAPFAKMGKGAAVGGPAGAAAAALPAMGTGGPGSSFLPGPLSY